jgi:hypothetical protein
MALHKKLIEDLTPVILSPMYARPGAGAVGALFAPRSVGSRSPEAEREATSTEFSGRWQDECRIPVTG